MIYEDVPYPDDSLEIKKMVKKAELYIRFGHYFGEKSMNWSTGEYEKGISVYPAILKDGIVCVSDDWIDDIESSWSSFEGRSIYVLTGNERDETGSDGEPVLTPSSIVIRGTRQIKLTAGLTIQEFIFRD